ncbi:hypothetical protein PMIN05_011173 [Paraphaeosphaeria minitans]
MENAILNLRVWKSAAHNIVEDDAKSSVKLANAPIYYAFDKVVQQGNNKHRSDKAKEWKALEELEKQHTSQEEAGRLTTTDTSTDLSKKTARPQGGRGKSTSSIRSVPQSSQMPTSSASTPQCVPSTPLQPAMHTPSQLSGNPTFSYQGYRRSPYTLDNEALFITPDNARTPNLNGSHASYRSHNLYNIPVTNHIPVHIPVTNHNHVTINPQIYTKGPMHFPFSPERLGEHVGRNAQATNSTRTTQPYQISEGIPRDSHLGANDALNANTPLSKRAYSRDLHTDQEPQARKKPQATDPASPFRPGVTQAPSLDFKASLEGSLRMPFSPPLKPPTGNLALTPFNGNQTFHDHGMGRELQNSDLGVSEDAMTIRAYHELKRDGRNSQMWNDLFHTKRTFDLNDSLAFGFEDTPEFFPGATQEHSHDAIPDDGAPAS